MRALLITAGLWWSGCATTAPAHGTWSPLTQQAATGTLCSHRVPEGACVTHHPELAAAFQRSGDWCGEHARPESQCLECHPDLSFEPLPALPEGADVRWLARSGDAVGPLEALAAPGKVTVVDFYADWCAPCRKVDAFLFTLVGRRADVAVRKLNVVSWETPLAREHLANVPTLPYLVVLAPSGARAATVKGFDLGALEKAIDEARR